MWKGNSVKRDWTLYSLKIKIKIKDKVIKEQSETLDEYRKYIKELEFKIENTCKQNQFTSLVEKKDEI